MRFEGTGAKRVDLLRALREPTVTCLGKPYPDHPATLDHLAEAGTHDRLNRYSQEACAACQQVLDRHGLPAIAEQTGSLWQVLFMVKPPRRQADMMAGDGAAMRRLDAECMKRGLYALPGVRRFFSTAHGDAELEDTLRILDDACRAFKR